MLHYMKADNAGMVVNKDYGKLYFTICEIFAFIVCIFCMCTTIKESKQFLFILPFSFFVVNLGFNKNFIHITDNIPKFLIVSMFFVRMVISPFFYSLCEGEQVFVGWVSVEENFVAACVLMAYEYLCVHIVLQFCKHRSITLQTMANCSFKKSDIGDFIIFSMLVFVVVVAVFFPQFSAEYKTIFNIVELDFTTQFFHNEYNYGTLGRMLTTLFSFSVSLLRVLIPAYLLQKTYMRNPHSSFCTIILILSCIAQFFIITSTFAHSIVAAVVLVVYYIKLYPSRKNWVFFFLILSILLVIISYFTIRYYVNMAGPGGMYSKGNNIIRNISMLLNAYFPGVDNVAAMFNVPAGYESETFFIDFIHAIPFNGTIFGTFDTWSGMQYYYNMYNASRGQIQPTIGVGYYYCGVLFSPLITMIFVYMSMKYSVQDSDEVLTLRSVANIFCSVVFALGTVMYNFSIALSWYIGWGLPMLFITSESFCISNKKEHILLRGL